MMLHTLGRRSARATAASVLGWAVAWELNRGLRTSQMPTPRITSHGVTITTVMPNMQSLDNGDLVPGVPGPDGRDEARLRRLSRCGSAAQGQKGENPRHNHIFRNDRVYAGSTCLQEREYVFANDDGLEKNTVERLNWDCAISGRIHVVRKSNNDGTA
jgi:hypothetical protein